MKTRCLVKVSKLALVSTLLLFMLVGCICLPCIRDHFPEATKITILFFNDTHGHLMPFKVKNDQGVEEEVGGIARLATLIKEIRRENEEKNIHTMVLIAGDILQGTPMSTVFQGKPDVEGFNAMKVDAMTVGNHEFDFGFDNFLALRDQANFPFLSANIIYKETGKRLCDPIFSISLPKDIILTILGVTTKDLLTTTSAENVVNLDVLDPVESVKEVFAQVGDKGPVVLLSHSKHETDRAIAEAIPDLAAIIGGHDQILLSPYREVAGVPIFQAFEKGRYLGRMDVSIDPSTMKAELISSTYIPVTSNIKPDESIAKIVESYYRQLDKRFKVVIGKTLSFLDGERDRVRYEETALGNFVADVMREHVNADVALVNSGGIRASLQPGPVTVEDVFKVMPYANEIVIVALTGADLRRALTLSVKGSREDEDGGFLHVSGIRFTVRGHDVEDVRVGDDRAPLEPDKVYQVAIPSFLSTGGDGYDIFVGKPTTNTRSPLRELLVDTIRNKEVISAQIEGRINRLP